MNRRAAVTGVTARQAVAMLTGLTLVTGGIVAAAAFVKPSKARAFDLFHGSIFLADDRAPVAVDLTNGNPTVRLLDAYSQVSARSDTDLDVTPLSAGTLLVNRTSGEFNMVDAAGFVVKTKGGGVPLPAVAGQNTTQVVPSASSAFIVQNSPGATGIYLVGQPTVEAARASTAKVKPRASLTLETGSTGAPGSAVSANGDLWLVTGTDKARALHQLSVPAGSSAGASLSDNPVADLPSVAAVGAATTHASPGSGATLSDDTTPTTVVGAATPEEITVFTPGEGGTSYTQQKVATTDTAKADRILPALGASGLLRFLYHVPGASAGAAGGWQSVSLSTDGKNLTTHRLGDLGDAALVQPVESDGTLYTMDATSGALWSIDTAAGRAQHVENLEQYPIVTDAGGKAQESNDFTDTYLTVRGSRVVINSPNHRRAVVLFTDGSRTPVTVDKSAAVDLNASGGAAEIANDKAKKSEQSGPSPAATPEIAPPAPQINAAVQCATSSQIPHIPVLSSLTPASRSVLLAWTYPLLDSQDCAPSTYTVSVRLVGGNAPPAPATVTVQGQAGVNLVGLYPNTRYEVKVTAFINGKGTPSDPAQFTTGPEGPTVATGVRASTDSAGNWNVSWNSCGGVTNACLPAAQWTVIPTYCDGLGLSSPPTSLVVSGDDTLSQFSTVFGGSGATLGRGISFEVQGVGVDGTAGSTSGSTACLYSWTPPQRSAFQVTASSPPTANFGQPTTSTVTLTVDGDPNVAGGGVGYSYNFQLLLGGAVVASNGATQNTVNVFDNITVAKHYKAQVIVTPPRHSDAAITVGPVDVDQASSAWPDMTATAAATNLDSFSAKITVQIAGLSSAAAGGERFNVSGRMFCGNAQADVGASSIDPADAVVLGPYSRLDYNGNCQIRNFRLTQMTGSFFGTSPTSSPTLSDISVTLDPPSFVGTAGDFSAAFDASAANVLVTYSGNPIAFPYYSNFTFILHRNAAGVCGGESNQPPAATAPQFSFATNFGACHDPFGGPAGTWSVEVTYTFLGANRGPFSVPVTGTPPTAGPPTPTPSPTPTATPIHTPTPTP